MQKEARETFRTRCSIMGNQLTLPLKLQPEHLAEVPKFVLKENLGEGCELPRRMYVMCVCAQMDYKNSQRHVKNKYRKPARLVMA